MTIAINTGMALVMKHIVNYCQTILYTAKGILPVSYVYTQIKLTALQLRMKIGMWKLLKEDWL